MKAWVVAEEFGIQNLKQVERAPSPLPADGVRVEVHACSLNYRDLLMVQGQYNPKQPLPLVPLSDGAGVVIEAGPESTWSVGDRVAATFFRDWQDGPVPGREVLRQTRGGPVPGMLAEEVVLKDRECVRLPDHVDVLEGATLPCAALTAWSALVEHGQLTASDTVLLQGTGGVALFGLQIAKAVGARVIQTSSSDDRLEAARGLGADETVNYRSDPNWGKTVQQLGGASHILELGGADTLSQSLRAVRPGGQLALIGNLGGAEARFNLLHAVMQNVRLQGILVGSRGAFERMNRAFAQNSIRPTVARSFGFEEVREAFTEFSKGGHFGKVCIRLR